MKSQHLTHLPALTLAAFLCVPAAGLAQSILLSAGNFTLLGGTAITSTGASGTNIVTGNVGLSPGATSGITSFPPAVITGGGALVATGPVTAQARLDLITASVALAGMPSNVNMSNVNLGGTTLAPGVYTFDAAAALNGALTLDAQGRNNVAWVFQIGTSLTTAINSSVTFTNLGSNGGSDLGLYWNAGSAITVGANNQIAGNYLAGTSITFGGGSSGGGRALALAGISLDGNTVNSHGGPASGDLAGGLTYNSAGDAVPASAAVAGGFAVPGGTVAPGGTVTPGGTVVAGASQGSSGSVVLGATGAYVKGDSSLVLVPGTALFTTLVTIDGQMGDGASAATLRTTAATVTLTGANTYTGGTYVDAGALITGSANLPANRPVTLSNGSGLYFTAPTDGAFGGAISGSGSVAKLGAGALTLNGANTYTGGTTVSAGTLIASSTTLPVNQDVTVASGGILAFNQTSDGTFAGRISGAGTVQKRGAGTLNLTNTTTSAVDHQTGWLYFNGGLGATTVASGASLGGTGTISGHLVNNGTVSPGYSPGRIDVTGNYTQGATGTLVIQLASATAFDLLAVTGTASLAGGLQVDALGGYSPIGQSFTFLTAAGGITGTFATYSTNITGSVTTAVQLTYAANSATLAFSQRPFSSFGQTPNQIAVGAAAQASPALTAALNAVPLASQIPPALNALSPQPYQVWSNFAFASSTALADRVGRRGRPVTAKDDYYFEGGQSRGRARSDADVGSSSYTTSTGLVGGNRPVGETTSAGAFFSYGKTTAGLGSAGSHTTVKDKTIGLRGGYVSGPMFAEAILAYGFHRYESTRPVMFPGTAAIATSSTRGHQWTTGFTVGQHLTRGRLTVSPFGGLLASRWTGNAFTERDAGDFNAAVAGQSARSLRSQLGAEGRLTLGMFQPHARAAWLHEFSDRSRNLRASLDGVAFAVDTRRAPRNAMLYSAGVDLVLGAAALLYTDFSAQSGGTTKVLDEWRVGLAVRY